MSVFEFWPDLAQAWTVTSKAPTAPSQATPGPVGRGSWRLIKCESRARVLWLETGGFTPAVLKIYRTPPHLAWRTLGLASRANREFTVMMEADRLGLPVVRPRCWLERRAWGCVEFCAITLDAIDRPNLGSWLTSGAGGREQRLRMTAAVGSLLGRFHRAGLFWGTAAPRNLLMSNGGGDSLYAIDLPYARFHDRDITGSGQAMIDLACVQQLGAGRPAFDDRERKAMMLAYCEGDADRAGDLIAQVRMLSRKEWKRKRILGRLINLLARGTRSAGRGGVYDAQTGEYRPLDSESEFVNQSVSVRPRVPESLAISA